MLRILQLLQVGPTKWKVWHDSDEITSPQVVFAESRKQIRSNLRVKIKETEERLVEQENTIEETEVVDDSKDIEIESDEADTNLPHNFFINDEGDFECSSCGFSTVSRTWVTRHGDCAE